MVFIRTVTVKKSRSLDTHQCALSLGEHSRSITAQRPRDASLDLGSLEQRTGLDLWNAGMNDRHKTLTSSGKKKKKKKLKKMKRKRKTVWVSARGGVRMGRRTRLMSAISSPGPSAQISAPLWSESSPGVRVQRPSPLRLETRSELL